MVFLSVIVVTISISCTTGLQEFCNHLTEETSSTRKAEWYPESCRTGQQRRGNRCFLKCEYGYEYQPGALMSADCVNKASVSWTPLDIKNECIRNSNCPSLVGQLYTNCKKSDIVPGDVCHLSENDCPTNEIVGPKFIKCLSNLTWSVGGAYCKEAVPSTSMTCGSVTSPIETDPNSATVDARKYATLPTLVGISPSQLILPNLTALKPSKDPVEYEFGFDKGPKGETRKCMFSLQVADKQAPMPVELVEEEERVVRRGGSARIESSPSKFVDNVDGEIAGQYSPNLSPPNVNFAVGEHNYMNYEAVDSSGNRKRVNTLYTVHAKDCKHTVLPIGVKMNQLQSGNQYQALCANPNHKSFVQGSYPFKYLFDVKYLNPFRLCRPDFKFSLPVLDCYEPLPLVNQACKKGYVADDDAKYCLPCPRGFRFFVGPKTGNDCELCPANHTTNQMASETCVPCPKNSMTVGNFRMCEYFCDAGEAYDGTKCNKCQPGTYAARGASTCTQCPPNHITIKEQASLLEDCVPGVILTQSKGSQDVTVSMATPFYIQLNMSTSTMQLHQRIGVSFQSAELSSLTSCDDGYVQVIGTFDSQFNTNLTGQLCGASISSKQYTVELRPWRDNFVKVYSKNKDVALKVTYSYDVCKPGQYFDLAADKCTGCPQGQFQDKSNRYECKPCVNGLTNYADGNSACIKPCPRGFEGNGVLCNPCPINTNEKNSKCVPCNNGEATAFERSTQCLSGCGSGEYRDANSGTCTKCPYGQYQPLTRHAQDTCLYCSLGQMTLKDGATKESDCVMKGDCKNEGQFYNTNTNKCEVCPLNTYKIASSVIGTSCTPCPNGMVTRTTGSIRLSDCIANQTVCDGQNNPCKFPGQCVEKNGKATCICPKYYAGQFCEQVDGPCKSAQCNNGKCVPFFAVQGQNYTCVCNPGFTGAVCDTAHDPCDPNPCNKGNCTNLQQPGEFKCTCPMYHTGKLCDTVIETPCQKASNCVPNQGICKEDPDVFGKFTCTCNPGYEGPACSKEIDYCKKNPCNSEGTQSCESQAATGTRKCVCKPGFRGDDCACRDGEFYWQKKCCTCIQGFYRGSGSTTSNCTKCPNGKSTVKRGAKSIQECIDLVKKQFIDVSVIVISSVYKGELNKTGCGNFEEEFEIALADELASKTGVSKNDVSVQITSYNQPPNNKLGLMVNLTIFGNNKDNERELKNIVRMGSFKLYSLDDSFMPITRTNEGEEDNGGDGGAENNSVVIIVVISIVAVVVIVILLVVLLKYKPCGGKKRTNIETHSLKNYKPPDMYT